MKFARSESAIELDVPLGAKRMSTEAVQGRLVDFFLPGPGSHPEIAVMDFAASRSLLLRRIGVDTLINNTYPVLNRIRERYQSRPTH